MGTREGVAAKIDAETRVKIDEMNKMVQAQQEVVSMTFQSKTSLYFFFVFIKKNLIKNVIYMRYALNKINEIYFCWVYFILNVIFLFIGDQRYPQLSLRHQTGAARQLPLRIRMLRINYLLFAY